jgi:hypothetical protein
MNTEGGVRQIVHRRVRRVAAFLTYLATNCLLIATIYGAVLASQGLNQPSPLTIPLIGSSIAFSAAVVGFGAGLLISPGSYSLWRCVAAAAAPIAIGALIAVPIGNMSPRDRGEWAASIAMILILAISFLVPRLIRIRNADEAASDA